MKSFSFAVNIIFSGLVLSQIAVAIASVSWLDWGCLSGAVVQRTNSSKIRRNQKAVCPALRNSQARQNTLRKGVGLSKRSV